ncbi:MAG: hypothetical protein J07HX64_01978 [halophilic archaeon J07HX64]|nr:MAG: hypothetical protein J07HX64_01978 [halophilic archaeon J07HX64]
MVDVGGFVLGQADPTVLVTPENETVVVDTDN